MRPAPSTTRRQILAWGLGAALGGESSVTSAQDASQASHEAPESAVARSGVHGMVLFGGREGMYGSHMPMFHAPHDVQAVMRLRAVDPGHERQLRNALAARPALWTLEPERFDLNRLDRADRPDASPRLRFKAGVYEGHFERGGQARLSSVDVEVERVLLFRTLDGALRRAARREFLWIGDGVEHFLVKRLDQRPDIDLIGRFRLQAARRAGAPLHLPGSPLAVPDAASLRESLARAGARPTGDVQWLYTETDDLA